MAKVTVMFLVRWIFPRGDGCVPCDRRIRVTFVDKCTQMRCIVLTRRQRRIALTSVTCIRFIYTRWDCGCCMCGRDATWLMETLNQTSRSVTGHLMTPTQRYICRLYLATCGLCAITTDHWHTRRRIRGSDLTLKVRIFFTCVLAQEL